MLMAGLHSLLRNDYCPNALVPKLSPHESVPMTSRMEGSQAGLGKRDLRPDHLRARQGRT